MLRTHLDGPNVSDNTQAVTDMTIDHDACVVGVDFGTLSGRAVVVRVRDGAELGTAVHEYRARRGRPRPARHRHARCRRTGRCRSRPTTSTCCAPPSRGGRGGRGRRRPQVIGIGTDFTACTMVPDTADGTPLCELPEFADRPHAYVKLWRHHAAQPQADRINELAATRGEPWLPRYGGLISSEWEFAKGLQVLEEAPEVYAAMEHWVEAADWIVWQLCGNYVRNACTAGYKGILQDGALPERGLPGRAQPRASQSFVADKLDHPIGSSVTGPAALTAAGRGLDRAAGGHRGRRRQRRRARHRAGRAGRRARPDGRDHGHLDLPRHERRRAARGARHVRRGRRRHRRRALGLRGRAERRRRHLRLVRRHQVPPAYHDAGARTRHHRARAAHRTGRRSRPSASTG